MTRRRLVRVPASSANLGPGFDVLACALGAPPRARGGRDRARSRVETDLDRRATARNLAVRGVRDAAPGRRVRVPDPLRRSRCPAAWARARRRSWPGCVAADPLFELDADLLGARDAARGPSRQRRRRAARRLRRVRRRRAPSASTSPAGLEARARRPARAGAHRRGARRAAAPRCRWRTPSSTSPTPALLVLGLARGDWDLVARGLDDRLHQPHRAHLYPRSMALVAPRAELGALGATISGAGPTVLVWCAYEATGAVVERLSGRVRGLGRGPPRAVRAARRRRRLALTLRPRRAAASACAASRSGRCGASTSSASSR